MHSFVMVISKSTLDVSVEELNSNPDSRILHMLFFFFFLQR